MKKIIITNTLPGTQVLFLTHSDVFVRFLIGFETSHYFSRGSALPKAFLEMPIFSEGNPVPDPAFRVPRNERLT